MKRLLVLVVVGAMVFTFAACGGGDDSSGSDAATEESPSEPAAEETEDPEPEEPEEEEVDLTACTKASKSKTEVAVQQVDFMFKPAAVKAPAGEMVTVVIQNKGTVDHTFTSDDAGCDSGLISPGTKATVTFKMPDKATEFYCIPHETAMTGKLVPT